MSGENHINYLLTPLGCSLAVKFRLYLNVTDELTAPLVIPAPVPPIVVENTGLFGDQHSTDITALVDDLYSDSDGVLSRINAELTDIRQFSFERYPDY